MPIKIKVLIPFLFLILIIGTSEARSDHSWQVRTLKSIAAETKSTNNVNNDAGTDSHHKYNFANRPDHLLGVKAKKTFVPETKSTIEKNPMNTNNFNNDAGTDSHYHYDFSSRPNTKHVTDKHPITTNGFDNDAGTDSRHTYKIPTPDQPWRVRAENRIAHEPKYTINDAGTDTHHIYIDGTRPWPPSRN